MARRSAGSTTDGGNADPRVTSSDHVDRILSEWGKELPDLETDAIAVVGRLMRASRLLQIDVEKSLGLFDLTISEFNTLCTLRRAGPPYRLSPKEVGVSL